MREWASMGVGHKFVDLGELVDYYHFPKVGVLTGIVPQRKEVGKRERRLDSMWRSKKRVQWLIEANNDGQAAWFFTATFSEAVTSYDAAVKAWEGFRRRLVTEFPTARYICVPEVQPVSKRWHFHAVIFGLGEREYLLKRYGYAYSIYSKMYPAFLRVFQKMWSSANGHVLNEEAGQFGDRTDIQEVRSVGAIAHYITKYLTKELGSAVPADRRCYFAGGLGLKRPKFIKYSNFNESLQNYRPDGDVIYKKEWEGKHVGPVIYKRFVKSPLDEFIFEQLAILEKQSLN